MIIGLSGKMGVGKDYLARHVIQPFIESRFPKERCINLAFADQLKINTIMKYQVPFESVFIKKNDQTRKLLQREGTENGRHKLGENIWINYTENWIETWKSRGFSTFILSDVRFCNEIDWIHNQGGVVIRIEAPKRSQAKFEQEFGPVENGGSHQSEIELDNIDPFNYDLVVDNDQNQNQNQIQLNLIYNFLSKIFDYTPKNFNW